MTVLQIGSGMQKKTSLVKNLTECEKAYIAGMIDADGSICKCKNKNFYVCKVRVHNCSKELMDWLVKTIGCGSVLHSPPAVEKKGWKHTKDRYNFDLSAKVDVLNILTQIYPYLIVKQKKAKEILDFLPTMHRPNKYNIKKSRKAKLRKDMFE